MTGELPAPPPPLNPETELFWQATAEQRLLVPRCDDCDLVFWYPRGVCPGCASTSIAWIESSGRGVIYSFTVTRRGTGKYRGLGSFVLAYVEIEEGPRLLTNVVECEPDMLGVGAPVEVVFHDTGEGTALPRFRLSEPATS